MIHFNMIFLQVFNLFMVLERIYIMLVMLRIVDDRPCLLWHNCCYCTNVTF